MESKLDTKRISQNIQNKEFLTQLLWILSIAVFIMSLAFLYGRVRWGYLGTWIFINPETLLHTDIYNDVFLNGGDYREWYISYAPSIFPEFLTYFITRQFFSDFITAMILTSITIYLTLLVSIYFLFTTVFKQASTAQKQLFITLVAAFNFLVGVGIFFMMRFFLLLPHYHVGMISTCLFSVAICWKILVEAKTKLIYVLVPLVIMATISDRMFLFSFVVPITFTLFILSSGGNKKNIRKLISHIWVASIVGVSLYFLLLPNSYPIAGTHIPTFKSSVEFAKLLTSIFTNMHLQFDVGGRTYSTINDVVILALLSAFFVLTLVLSARRNPPKAYENKINRPQGLFLASYTVAAFLAAVTVSITRVVSNPTDLRHLTTPITIGFFGAIFLGILLIPKNISQILAPSISLILIIVLLLYPKPTRNMLKKDAMIDCLDKNFYTYGLKRGIAGYWQTRNVNMFSAKGIKITPVKFSNNVLQPNVYLATKQHLLCKGEGCTYNFAILDGYKLKEDALINVVGPPKDTFECSNYKIYVYDPDEMTEIILKNFTKFYSKNRQYLL